jgi:hypothetical protein
MTSALLLSAYSGAYRPVANMLWNLPFKLKVVPLFAEKLSRGLNRLGYVNAITSSQGAGIMMGLIFSQGLLKSINEGLWICYKEQTLEPASESFNQWVDNLKIWPGFKQCMRRVFGLSEAEREERFQSLEYQPDELYYALDDIFNSNTPIEEASYEFLNNGEHIYLHSNLTQDYEDMDSVNLWRYSVHRFSESLRVYENYHPRPDFKKAMNVEYQNFYEGIPENLKNIESTDELEKALEEYLNQY